MIVSHSGDDFNAIDPNILTDSDQRIWLTHGSYWSGIKQRQIDPATGMILAANAVRYELAARPGVADDAVEVSSLIHHGSFYYLFLSVDHCCATTTAGDNYKQIVGRSSSPNGIPPCAEQRPQRWRRQHPARGNSSWMAPGGGTAYLDDDTGDALLVFHALDRANHGTAASWIKSITWQNDWP